MTALHLIRYMMRSGASKASLRASAAAAEACSTSGRHSAAGISLHEAQSGGWRAAPQKHFQSKLSSGRHSACELHHSVMQRQPPGGGARSAAIQCRDAAASSRQTPVAQGTLLQHVRGLLGVVKRAAPINYQDHNKAKPRTVRVKTPSAAKRRVIVGKDGTMWRRQAGRSHYRSTKRKSRLRALKGLVPLAPAMASKLRRHGFKRRWWYNEKS